MLNRSLLFSLALLLTVDVGNYLNANEDNKIIYEKDYFNQFNITNVIQKAMNQVAIKREVLVHQELKY